MTTQNLESERFKEIFTPVCIDCGGTCCYHYALAAIERLEASLEGAYNDGMRDAEAWNNNE